MAATTGIGGLLAASGGNSTNDLIDAVSWYSATPTINSAEIETTAFASSLAFATYVQDLYDWNISAQGRFPGTGQAGFNCSVSQTGTDLYLDNVYGFTIDISAPVVETTDLTATAAKTFTYGGPLVGRFTLNARVDGTNALKLPTVATAAPGHDLSFVIGSEDTNDDIVQVNGTNGGARILSVSPNIAVGSVNDVTITGIFSGRIDIDGDNALFAVAAAGTPEAMPLPETDTVTLTMAPSRTLSGSAFYSNVSVSASVGSAIDVSATFQGTGAITPA